jgi:RNA polymerase sigma factor for flagellar operon FliA
VGSDEKRLSRTILRITTIESTSPLASGEHVDESSLPPALVPSEPDSPAVAYEKRETRDRVRTAIQGLPWRERKVIGLYYYGEVTMKEIGAEIGVNESRVSQLHARAIKRLREALGEMNPDQAVELRHQLVAFATAKPKMAKAAIVPAAPGVLLEYKPASTRPEPKRQLPARAVKMARPRRQAIAAVAR